MTRLLHAAPAGTLTSHCPSTRVLSDYLLAMFCDSQSRPSYRPSPEVAHVLWMYLQTKKHSTYKQSESGSWPAVLQAYQSTAKASLLRPTLGVTCRAHPINPSATGRCVWCDKCRTQQQYDSKVLVGMHDLLRLQDAACMICCNCRTQHSHKEDDPRLPAHPWHEHRSQRTMHSSSCTWLPTQDMLPMTPS